MALKKAARGAQYVLSTELVLNFNDTVVDINGATKAIDGSVAGPIVLDAINLPPGSRLIGGEWVSDTAFNGTTFTVSVGDATLGTRYLVATDLKAGGVRTPLVLTGFRNDSGGNIRLSISPTGTHTAGKGPLRAEYVIEGRANEVQTS
jgi:hypothetical protein